MSFKTVSGLWCPQGVSEGVPQPRCSSTEGPVSRGPQPGSGDMERVSVGGAEGAGCVLLEKFFEVGGGMSMDALVCEEGNLVFNAGGDRKPVE